MEPHCARYAPPAGADCTTFLNLGCTECCISCLASDSLEWSLFWILVFSFELIASQSMRDTATYACQDPIHNPISYNLMSQFVWPISATYFSETNEAWKVDRTQFNPCLLPIAFSSQWFRPALKGFKARTNVWAVERCKKSRALQHEDILIFRNLSQQLIISPTYSLPGWMPCTCRLSCFLPWIFPSLRSYDAMFLYVLLCFAGMHWSHWSPFFRFDCAKPWLVPYLS